MDNVIQVPFGIDYKTLSSMIIAQGPDAVHAIITKDGFRPSVATRLIRRALSKGWGS